MTIHGHLCPSHDGQLELSVRKILERCRLSQGKHASWTELWTMSACTELELDEHDTAALAIVKVPGLLEPKSQPNPWMCWWHCGFQVEPMMMVIVGSQRCRCDTGGRDTRYGTGPQGRSTHRYSVQAGNKEGWKAIRGWPRSQKGGDETGRYSLGVEGIERWWKTRWAQGRLGMLGGDSEGSGTLGDSVTRN